METFGTRTSAGSFIVGIERNPGVHIRQVELHLAVEVGERDTETLRQLLGTMFETAGGPFAGGSADAQASVVALIGDWPTSRRRSRFPKRPGPPPRRAPWAPRGLADGAAGKARIDATRTWPLSEGFSRPWPEDIVMSPEVKRKIESIWSRLGIET
jgi:hypothetical protein